MAENHRTLKTLEQIVFRISVLTLVTANLACGRQSVEIRIDQIGFYPTYPKLAVVRNAGPAPFYLIDVATGDTVFRGTLSSQQQWSYSGESVSKADFTSYTIPGRYTLAVPGGTNSPAFEIRDRVHDSVAVGALKGFYYQRASTPLLAPYAGIWARAEGHPDTAVLIHTSAASPLRPANSIISCPGGWYDAGDYNEYIINSGISTYTILATYEHFPVYCDEMVTNIPESSNAIPDILDEALWNIRWMLTMQDPNDGGVYHKLTNKNFDGWVMPAAATMPRYVVMKSTGATLDFAAVMAQSARIFRAFSAALPGFADSCEIAALRAWSWARKNPSVFYVQPSDITTGAYGDGYLQDEFNWAAAELTVTTAQDSFLTVANPLNVSNASVPGWGDVNTLGLYTLAQHASSLGGLVDTSAAKSKILTLASSLVASKISSAYDVVMGFRSSDFVWGSNGVAANQGMALLCAYQISGDSTYVRAALSNLEYLLGRNGTGYCFVTGFGSHPPMSIHHRPSQADGIPAPDPGLLVGGPNPRREDGLTNYPSTMPALCYVDNYNSYASNEICINWNAPLVFLAVGIEALASPNGLPTGLSNHSERFTLPDEQVLLSCYPNPFNPTSNIEYTLPHSGRTVVTIYNALGQEVRQLFDGWMSMGTHSIRFDASGLASGVYICRVKAGSTVASIKMILSK